MTRKKVDAESGFNYEWSVAITPKDATRVLEWVIMLVKERNYTGHAKLGETDLQIIDDAEATRAKVKGLGGPERIDFIIGTKQHEATVFADFDTARLEVRAASTGVRDELLKEWKRT